MELPTWQAIRRALLCKHNIKQGILIHLIGTDTVDYNISGDNLGHNNRAKIRTANIKTILKEQQMEVNGGTKIGQDLDELGIQSGMIVNFRNGDVGVVVRNGIFGKGYYCIYDEGIINLENINLSAKADNIYIPDRLDVFDVDKGELVWPQPKTLKNFLQLEGKYDEFYENCEVQNQRWERIEDYYTDFYSLTEKHEPRNWIECAFNFDYSEIGEDLNQNWVEYIDGEDTIEVEVE